MSGPEQPPILEDPTVLALAGPLFREQKEAVVWAARCCNRVSVNARQAPVKCGKCGKPPVDVVELRSDPNVG